MAEDSSKGHIYGLRKKLYRTDFIKKVWFKKKKKRGSLLRNGSKGLRTNRRRHNES